MNMICHKCGAQFQYDYWKQLNFSKPTCGQCSLEWSIERLNELKVINPGFIVSVPPQEGRMRDENIRRVIEHLEKACSDFSPEVLYSFQKNKEFRGRIQMVIHYAKALLREAPSKPEPLMATPACSLLGTSGHHFKTDKGLFWECQCGYSWWKHDWEVNRNPSPEDIWDLM